MICENDTERTLWRNYVCDRTLANRNALVEYYYPRCFMTGKRYSLKVGKNTDPSNDVFDYTNDAALGLIDAVERFDPRQKVKFITYSGIRVYGQIHDEARRQSGLNQPLLRKQKRYEKKMTYPNANQEKVIKDVFGSRQEYEKHQRSMRTQKRSKVDLRGSDRAEMNQDIHEIELLDFKYHVMRSIGEPELKLIFNLVYIEGMTQTDVARLMGLSDIQMYRKHKKIIAKIKRLFSKSELKSILS